MTLATFQAFDTQQFSMNDVEIEAIEDRAMISVAIPKGGEKKLIATLKKSFGLTIPKIGSSESAKSYDALGVQSDQFYLLLPYKGPESAMEAQKLVGSSGYTTDQSDGWVFLRAHGGRVNEALARICKLDLERFEKGQVARTMMDHLGVIIFAQKEQDYLLMSARSSAQNFWHALTVSAANLS